MSNKKSGAKTLLMSVIMSSPGPLLGIIGLFEAQSSTQIADVVRRSIELLAIILSFVVYTVTTRGEGVDEGKKRRYERGTNVFVSVAMVISGIIMIAIALTATADKEGHSVIGLIMPILGVVANSIFWIKYSRLGRETDNKILVVQGDLYRAKTFVDLSVVIALSVVLFAPDPTVAYYFDMIGTVAVSVYLVFTGVKSFVKEIRHPI